MPRERKSSHIILWLPCVIYYLLITVLSAVPGQNFDGLVVKPFEHFDKFVHFFLYAFLGMIVSRALSWEEYYHHLHKRWYVYFALIIPLAAMLDEAHQYFVPNRSMDIYDWGVDLVGACFGALVYILVVRGRRKGRTETEIHNRDVRGFGLIVAMIYFLVLVSLNIFDYKGTFFRNYRHISFVLVLAEFGLLGLLSIRFFYMKHGKRFFLYKDWIWVCLAASFFVGLYQYTLVNLQSRFLEWQEVLWAWISFNFGAVGYYLDKQIGRFRDRIWQDPLYKRKTWQRVYFFFPPFVLMSGILYLSSKSPAQLYGSEIPMPQEIISREGYLAIFRNFFFLHALQFFIFGSFFFRAVAWETWWHQQSRQKILWMMSVVFVLAFALGDELLQAQIPGRVGDVWDVLTNVAGAMMAFVIYLYGYRVAKQKFFSEQPKLCSTKTHFEV